MASERIKVGLKLGRIQIGNSNGSSNGGNKKPFVSYPRKKEGETSVVHADQGRGRNHQHQQINVVTILVNTPQQQRPQQ